MSYTEEVIKGVKGMLESNGDLNAFFKNQQRFIHLYLLGKGCEITSRLITDIVETMDRKFSPQTYYHLRRELEEKKWIRYVKMDEATVIPHKNPPGPKEVPHKVDEDRAESFSRTLIETGTIERPVSISKYHLFDMGLRFSDLDRGATFSNLIDDDKDIGLTDRLKKYLENLKGEYTKPSDFIFYPHFLLMGIIGLVLKKGVKTESPKKIYNWKTVSVKDKIMAEVALSQFAAFAKGGDDNEPLQMEFETTGEETGDGVFILDQKGNQWVLSGHIEVKKPGCHIRLLLPENLLIDEGWFSRDGDYIKFGSIPLNNRIDLSKIEIELLTEIEAV
jgi:hypothetical protein